MSKPKKLWVDGKDFFHWKYEQQTEMKHKVVAEYFRVWATKLGQYSTPIFFDCFGGCGAYLDDLGVTRYGSPFLMAKEAQKLNSSLGRNIEIYATEPDKDNFENLKKVADSLKGSLAVMPTLGNMTFEQLMGYRWTRDKYQDEYTPTLFLLDPFGFSLAFKDIEDIMRYPRNEMIINFMFDYISRFIGKNDPALEGTYTSFFGTEEWRDAIPLSGEEREKKLVDIYKRQLKKNAKYVFPFKLSFPDKDRTYYYLFHVTNNRDGCSIMKSAFASNNFGRVEYLGKKENILTLFDMTAMKVSDIRLLLKKKYAGQEKSFNEIIDEIIDDTPYLEKNIRATIKSMEKDSEVRITRITSKPSGKGLQQEDRIFFNQETQMSLF